MKELCKRCARWETFYDKHNRNKLEGTGAVPSDIMLITEYLNEDEAIQGKHLIGKPGVLLNELLLNCGVTRDSVYITSAVKCWADDNKAPTLPEIKKCRPYLLQEINKVRPKIIVTLGKTALTSLGISIPIQAAVNKLHRSEYTTVPVFPIYNPEYTINNPSLKQENLKYLKAGLSGEVADKKEISNKGYVVVKDFEQAEKVTQFLINKAKMLAFDIETDGLDFLNKKYPLHIKCVGFCYGVGKAVIFDGETMLPYVKRILESNVRKVAHNIKFDAGFLQAIYKIKVNNIFMDTMLAAYQMDENTPNDLEFCTSRYVPELHGYASHISSKYGGRTDKANGEDLWAKNFGDVDATFRLAVLAYKQLVNEDMWWLHKNILIPATINFMNMEEYGVQCDRELINRLEEKYVTAREDLIRQIKEIPEVLKFEQENGCTYNSGSPIHNKKIFIDFYKLPILKESKITGDPSIGSSELLIYAEKYKNKLAKLVREVRLIDKAISTYLSGFVKYLYDGDIAHTQFNLNVTATGRTSSGGGGVKEDPYEDLLMVNVDPGNRRTPNLQNINKKNKELRNIIRARDNRYLIGADYSQVELAVAAAISRDEVMMAAYMSDNDLHTQIASETFGIPYKEVTKELRQYAKTISFGITYGMSAKALAKQIGKEETEAQDYINSYFKRFHKLQKMLDGCKLQVDKRGYVISPFGRRRRFAERDHKAHRQAMNFPVQATASDLLLLSMNFVTEKIKALNINNNIKEVLAVHDELNIEVAIGYIKTGIDLLKKAMTEDIYTIPRVAKLLNPLKLKADVQISPLGGGWGMYTQVGNFNEEILGLLDSGALIINKEGQVQEIK